MIGIIFLILIILWVTFLILIEKQSKNKSPNKLLLKFLNFWNKWKYFIYISFLILFIVLFLYNLFWYKDYSGTPQDFYLGI